MYELRDEFTFDVPGAKYIPSFKSKVWDGKIHLYNVLTGLIYVGLRQHIDKFCKKKNYEIEYISDFSAFEFSLKEAQEFIKTLKLPFEPRDYQIEGFVYAIRNRRALLLSATASGKSLCLYLIARYLGLKTLILVPTIGLVSQMQSDFRDYGYQNDIHMIYSGQEKQSEHLIHISTWQSLFRLPKSFFSEYQLVIVDECHTAKAKSLTSILTKMDCKYRVGVTGTLDGILTHKLVLEGLFNPVKTLATTKELIDAGHISNLDIKCILLSYPDQIKKDLATKRKENWNEDDKTRNYHDELDFLISSPDRNRFIRNLALSLEGNTLVLFKFEKHGKYLHEIISNQGRKVYYVFGDVGVKDRDFIRKIIETETNAIIVASVGTFATGINIKALHNIIFTSPTKDKIRILQAIGRTLRRTEEKTQAVLYDLADDLSWKSYKNFTLKHFNERTKLYESEQFPYKIYKIALKIDAQERILFK